MPTYTLPTNLGDILGAHHDGNFQTAVMEIKAGIGVLTRGTILATGTAGDIGKLVPLAAGTEAQAYGVLLDPAIDTSVAFSGGMVTGSIAKKGSFRGPALIVPAGVDAGLIAVALRGRGIFIEGPITVSCRRCRPYGGTCRRRDEGADDGTVKLKYHCITHGRYYLAGEEVPDAPPSFAKYAVSEDGDAADLVQPKPVRKYAVSRPERMYPGVKSKRAK